MNRQTHAALRAAKIERTHAITALAEALEAARAGAARSESQRAEVEALASERAACVSAGDVEGVRAADERLSRGRIALEVETAAAARLEEQHTAAVDAHRAALAAVERAARAVLDAELLDLAEEFTAALDEALALGARLQSLAAIDGRFQPVNVRMPVLPPSVTVALARVPEDGIHTPVNVLRRGVVGTGFAERLKALAA